MTKTSADALRLRQAFRLTLMFTGVLWLIMVAGYVTGYPITHFGIYPGHISTLTGVLLAPLIHGSFAHLISNTPAVIVLGTAILYEYPRAARVAIPALWLAPGLYVWLFARSGYHIGASGMTVGLMFFIFLIGVLRRDRPAMALSMLVFFLYGGMIWSVFPQAPQISFEFHMGGAITGILLAIALRHRDPPAPRKHYDWEDDENEPSRANSGNQ